MTEHCSYCDHMDEAGCLCAKCLGRRDRRDARREGRLVAEPAEPVLVVIESPYAGDVEHNERYARAALADSLARGEAPIASHLLYTQPGVLDDTVPAQRAQGIAAGLAWARHGELSAVYVDLGVTGGMRQGIANARQCGRQVERRRVPGWAKKAPAKAGGAQ